MSMLCRLILDYNIILFEEKEENDTANRYVVFDRRT